MTSNVILWVLALAGLVTLLLKVAVELRDRAVDDGWVKDDSWLGKSRRRGLQRRLAPALSAIGITADHFDALRAAAADQAGKRRATDSSLQSRPDEALLAAIKPWIVRLDDGAAFRGNDRYVDTMGLVHHRATGTPSLAAITDAWVALLRRAEKVDPFDCVVTLKDGNPVLIAEFCNRVSPTHLIKPILCKSPRDPSRIDRDSGAHETDFEGLRAFLESAEEPAGPRTKYRALALDDNCTSGRSLFAAIEEFNEFVQAKPDDFPIEPITQAAVLFVVNAGHDAEFAFADTSVALHAMLAVGSGEMKRIEEAKSKELESLADEMKGHAACVFSASLGANSALASATVGAAAGSSSD